MNRRHAVALLAVLFLSPLLMVPFSPIGAQAAERPTHGYDRVVVGGSVQVQSDETVNDAVAVGGTVRVLGHVRGDAVAIGGNVTLTPGASIDGDAVAIGGEVQVPPGARLGGDSISIGGSAGTFLSALLGLGTVGVLVSVFGTVARTVVMLVLGLLLVYLIPERITRIRAYLAERPGVSTAGGLGLMFGFVPLCVLLAISLVGIPLIPVAVLGLGLILLMGLTAVATCLGYRLPILREDKTEARALVLGVVVLGLVDLVPFVGTLLVFIAAFVAGGAVLASRFGQPVNEGAKSQGSD